MKKIAFILSSFCAVISYAQKVSDYKYIVVPKTYESFKKDNYGLDVLLSKKLKAKQYTVLSENRGEWSSEANTNPCDILTADVINDSGFLKNKILIEFKDCNNKVIASEKGSSSIKEFEEGYADALNKALATLPNANPVENKTTNKEVMISEVVQEKPQISEPKSEMKTTKSATSGAEKFSNGKITVQKIQIGDGQFILADGNSSIPFATFKETTKKDVFRVKLSSGESTTGYYENGNLIIEMPKGNDEYSKEVFSALR